MAATSLRNARLWSDCLAVSSRAGLRTGGGREEEGEGNEYVCVVAVSRMTVMGVILLTMMTVMRMSANPSKMTLKHRVIID